RVDSSEDKPNLGEDASKQGRIEAIDADEDITLVNDQVAEMFDVTDLHSEELFVEKDVNAAGELNAASIATTISVATIIPTEEVTLAKALVELKASKPKVGLIDRVDSSEDKPNLGEDASKQGRIEAIDADEDITLVNDQVAEMFDVTDLHSEELFVEKDVNAAGELNAASIATTISVATIITTEEGKKSYYQIIRADGNSNMCMVFNIMLKEFDREKLEDLYSLVKAKYGSTRTVEDLDLLLWDDLKTMFKPHVEDQVWKKQHG
nr:hypothetical protein [Tanacetum cinerariifolium]